MEKEFVTYNLALELKELGFDEPCFGYRDGCGYLMIKSIPHCVISAPLYQQAFRWLYHKLDIEKGVMPLDVESQQILLKELIDKVSSKHLLV